MSGLKHIRELEKRYNQNEDYDVFYSAYKRLSKRLNEWDAWDMQFYFVDFQISIKRYKDAWEEYNLICNENGYRDILQILKFELILGKPLMNSRILFHFIYSKSCLTEFGMRNINSIYNEANKVLQKLHNDSFFKIFYSKIEMNEISSIRYVVEGAILKLKAKKVVDYKSFFDKENFFLKWEDAIKEEKSIEKTASKHFVNRLISYQASKIFRDAENSYRESIGAKRIGEGWISETELFYLIKQEFNEEEVIHHGKPSWLGRQHVDIWFPEYQIGIEYQGLQHDKPVDYFGGKEAFVKGQERDKKKKRLFKKNNGYLIEVRENYKEEILFKNIRTIINKEKIK